MCGSNNCRSFNPNAHAAADCCFAGDSWKTYTPGRTFQQSFGSSNPLKYITGPGNGRPSFNGADSMFKIAVNGGTNNIGYFAAGSISGTRNAFPFSPDCNCGGHADENEKTGKKKEGEFMLLYLF